MRVRGSALLVILLAVIMATGGDALADRRVRTTGSKKAEGQSDAARKGKDDLKPFADLIKDRVKIEGLFTFYRDTTDNSMLMEIKPAQIGPIYLCSEERSRAEGAFYDNAAMMGSYPFYFERIGKNIMFMEKNVRFRADSTATLRRAVESGISDHLRSSTSVKSSPQEKTGAILVDPADFFIKDAENIGFFLGQTARLGVSFDQKNSYFSVVKSFPQNTEIDVKLHYRTTTPINAETMQNPYSLFHTYHYSLSTLPQTDYIPRIADDRIGYFLTMYEDYSRLDSYSPYVRYVNRWNLKKKNPGARISEPVEPIVFWVENTVPVEYRDAVAEGIEFWNQAYEKIGFRSAVVAKQMPDTATWDPADVRYNTVRWILVPGGGYAAGPSHANPFTGQIYDADIRVCSDFIRYMFNNMEYFIKPVSREGMGSDSAGGIALPPSEGDSYEFQREAAKEAAFGLNYLLTNVGDIANKDSLTREYVHSYIVELIAHEVGHTLGLRHNFKSSMVYSLSQISDREFTRKHGTCGSIMDYTPPNIAGKGKPQGEFYASVPGPYDNWAIEYGYSELGAKTPEEELPELKKIASRAGEFDLLYGSDEDVFGNSVKSIDPDCNMFDMGDDPLDYSEHKIKLTEDLWKNSLDKFEQPGEGFQKVLRAFANGWRSYYESVNYATKYVGGLRHNRYHVGDKAGVLPFKPVPAAEQRRAMKLVVDKVFAANAFDLPDAVLNKLQPERFDDFMDENFTMPQIDYPIHAMALAMQAQALNRLYSPYILGRLINNLERYSAGETPYTMYDMFTDVRQGIWGEAEKPENVNSFRRQLQLAHLSRLVDIYLSPTAMYPADARTLAANDLNILESSVGQAVKAAAINNMTKAHFQEVLRQIAAAKGAKRDYTRF